MGSKDKRIFRHFVLTCCKCNVSLTSIGDISAHLRHCSSIKKQSKNDSIDVRCGCCAKSFISWRRLVHHLNQPGVHLRQRCTISDTPTSPESSVPLPAVTSIFQGSFSGLTSTYTPTAVALLSAGSFSVPYTTSVSNFSSSHSVSPRYSPVTEPISPATTVSIPFSCDESFTSNPTSDTHSNSSAVLRTPDPYDYDGTDQHYQSSDYSFSPFMSNFQVPSLSFSPDSFQDTYTSDFLDTSVTTVQTSNLPSSDTFTSSICSVPVLVNSSLSASGTFSLVTSSVLLRRLWLIPLLLQLCVILRIHLFFLSILPLFLLLILHLPLLHYIFLQLRRLLLFKICLTVVDF